MIKASGTSGFKVTKRDVVAGGIGFASFPVVKWVGTKVFGIVTSFFHRGEAQQETTVNHAPEQREATRPTRAKTGTTGN